MRAATATLILVAMISLNAKAAVTVKDPRLAQKVTYQVKLRPIADLTKDLSAMTHITFTAGRANSDWRVREDCATVLAKDIPLATLMDSIAHALKFRWVRTGDAPNWFYRLAEDPAAVAAIKDKEDSEKQKKLAACRETWDHAVAVAAMSEADLAKIKDSDPSMYLTAKLGVLGPTVELFQQVPELKQAFMFGEDLKIASCWLSPKGQQAVVRMAQAAMRADMQLWPKDQATADAMNARLADVESKPDQYTFEMKPSPFAEEVGCFGLSVRVDGVMDDWWGIPIQSNDFVDSIARLGVAACEQNRPLLDLIKENRPQLKECLAKERERLQALKPPLGCDPGTTHPADLLKADSLQDKVESKTITEMVASFAQASGYAVVTADLRGNSDLRFEKGSSVREDLDKMAETYSWNWNKDARVLELWSSDWHELRESRVSKVWLEAMKNKLKTNGTLDIDDLAQIAALTDAQYSRVVKDDVMCCLAGGLDSDALDFMRIYALFSTDQRLAVFSETGLPFGSLTAEQQGAIMKKLKAWPIPVLPSIDLNRVGMCIFGTKERQGKSWVYKLGAAVGGMRIPGEYELKTPVYVPPVPKPTASADAKTQSAVAPAAK